MELALRDVRRVIAILAGVVATSCLLIACDPEGKKECAWFLEPEPKLIGTVDPGYIPVCARNRTSMKEDCRLQSTLDYAKQVFGRKFRYVDMRVANPGLPRTITGIRFCDGKD